MDARGAFNPVTTLLPRGRSRWCATAWAAGPSTFRRWNKALQEVVLPLQVQRGCQAGSWLPDGEWCAVGGRVYATAINALTLETYYRYTR